MKLILTAAVDNLGLAGDIVEVKDGYGRNYLVPRGYALRWTKGGEKQIDGIKRSRDAREIRGSRPRPAGPHPARGPDHRAARSAPARAASCSARSPPADVATAVKKSGGPAVDKRSIEIGKPIKYVGSHTVGVKLHEAVTAHVAVAVTPQA